MRDLAGTTILHYTILRAIGSGGMGVVYEAQDTKLGRRVALKFLPPAVAADPEALERFGREARAASALNHPNICTIHAIEEADAGRFIVMELLEGEPLDVRIASRPLTWDTLLDCGIQIADALEAAHRRGIVHRDIKPANIFLTPDGRAKVLDFGVAKIAHPAAAMETLGEATVQRALTSAGSAVGTIAYMSPEQARGEEIDARSDLFSFAAVLYEMSTGRRAFDGKTTAVVFNKILESTPELPREINPTLPAKLEDVILRGLEKDRELRYQSAADLRADLRRLKRDASSGRLAFVPPAAAAGAPRPLSSGAVIAAEARRHKGVATLVAFFALALTGAAVYGIYDLVKGEADPAASATLRATTPQRLTTSGDVHGCGSISPDGKYVVYCDYSGRLRLLQIATGATVDLGLLQGDTTFSPDSNLVYVTIVGGQTPDGVLWRIPSLGGEPRRILSGLGGAVGISPDGKRIAFVRRHVPQRRAALMIADADGANQRELVTGSLDETWPETLGVSWSHDGALLSFTQATIVGGYRMRPAVANVATGRVEALSSTTWSELGRTAWLPDNRGILFTARDKIFGPFQFWIVSYPDGARSQITSDTRGFGRVSVSVTADGSTAATVPTDTTANVWSTNADATAPLEQWTSGARFDGGSGMSADASGRLYFSSSDGSEIGIWSIDAPGSRPRRVIGDYAEIPTVPDNGAFLVFQAIHDDRYRIWRSETDGSGAHVLSRGEDDIVPLVSPDGRWIYYWAAGAKGTIMRMAADGSQSSPLTELPVAPGDISPDGTEFLAMAQDGSVGADYLVLDTSTGSVKTRIDVPEGAIRLGWSRNRDTLAYILTTDRVSNLWEMPASGGPARPVTKFTSGEIFSFAYNVDRTRLFISRGQRSGDVVILRNFY